MPAASQRLLAVWLGVVLSVLVSLRAQAADAPQWMHAAAAAPLPDHDERTDAVLVYEQEDVVVQSADKIKTHVRLAYKILRPSGREYGFAVVSYRAGEKISDFHGWCIPAQGKDYEVKDKDAVEMALPKIEGSELVSDVRSKVLQIPAPDPGNVVGYEYQKEEQPLVLQDEWDFQREIPVAQTHYSLQLPPGWAFKAYWLNYPETKPVEAGGQLQWNLGDIKAIRNETDMPPRDGVSGEMVVSYFPQGGLDGDKVITTWQQMGKWELGLATGRRDASPEIKQEVASLTSSAGTPLAKMQALAKFVQQDVRYVAIELGIGGWQPHSAAQIFTHHYGDCKDKATLMSSMLSQIGIDSYYVVINSRRGSVTSDTPANPFVFNHMILAIKLPPSLSDATLVATVQHPKLGTLLYFDPTNELTPFGQISGHLQANYAVLVTPDGGELVRLPQQSPSMNSIVRAGTFTLDAAGTLKGEVSETRMGDRAWSERYALRQATKSTDRIKPIEDLLSGSLSLYQITQASLINLDLTDQPFGFRYALQAPAYAKNVGNMLLVRPRVIGVKTEGFLETKEARKFPVDLGAPLHDTDSFDITIPAGFVVDDVPPPVDVDDEFADYHAKTEVKGNVIHYSRTFEIKELSVPVAKVGELKTFYRVIAGDERNTVVLRSGN
ncbi:MAG TPA: DUF3857 and transglutaminase domain-containing protein [Verrucomicrobiae bacterium]|nr:DUF3857 and transglutaminase domain-containing protein [Verrucomicrobiae bacterium]